MFHFKDLTLKEATLATIIDQFQHDYSTKLATFIESKAHLCKSCNGDSDTLIFLTPIQSMKLGMSILDTFHERKLKQLNQRLQSMILNHFSSEQNQKFDKKDFLRQFHQNLHDQQSQEKEKYFQQTNKVFQQTKPKFNRTIFNPISKFSLFLFDCSNNCISK